ncbi:MAG: site-2 protease family protein [Candidatus Eiseniibacteriota bacterium]
MRWSWQIAKVAGIPIRVHATFLLFVVFIYFTLAQGQSPAKAAETVGFFLALFGCVVLHELGHATAARRYGVRTRDITLLPIGGVARLERIPEKPSQEIVVALAGPAVNIAIAGILLVALAGSGMGLQALTDPVFIQENFFARLLAYNVFLAVFNLIPAFPMDGGRVLRALLATRLDYMRATQIAANVGQGIALLFGLLGILGNPILLFIALFVFIGAGTEAAAVQMRSAFLGVPVSKAMIRDFRALRADEPLARAVELLLSGHQQDFPVLGMADGERTDGERAVGILTRADLLKALAAGRTDQRVGEAARRGCGSAHPREMLGDVFRRMKEGGCPAVPVLESDGSLVGMVTLENVGELAMVQAALDARARSRGGAPA